MKTTGLDTNVLITLKLERQTGFDEARSLLFKCLEGKVQLFIPTAAFLETEWVLRSYYKYPKKKIIEYFEELLVIDNVISDNKDELTTAIHTFKEKNTISFTDSVIITQIQTRGYEFLTFDEDLQKIYKEQ